MSDTVIYSKEDSIRLHNLFSVQMFFMKAFGQMNPKPENFLPPTWKTLGVVTSQIFRICTTFLILHLAMFYAVTAWGLLHNGDLEDITDGLSMLPIYSFATFGSVYWIFRSQNLEIFFESINKGHEPHSLAGLTFVSSHRPYNVARKLTTYWQCACISGVVFWVLSPLILHQRVLPVKCWYPFDTKREYVYELTYFVQFLAQCVMGAVFANGTALYVSLTIIILGQFDVLFCSLKNVQSHGELLAGGHLRTLREKQNKIFIKDDETNQYFICKEHKVDMNIYASKNNQLSTRELRLALQYSMKRCILHHQFILRSCAKLEELYSPYCLMQSLQITVQLCLLVFVGVVGDRSFIRIVNLLAYVCFTLFDLLMFTYFGELLRTQSLRAGEAFMRSPWHKNTYLIKQEILIFLANTNKPVEITAGKLFVMNIERLKAVLTQSFSFLTLLQKIAEKP